jgi:multidrug efflux system membrane fusion protein
LARLTALNLRLEDCGMNVQVPPRNAGQDVRAQAARQRSPLPFAVGGVILLAVIGGFYWYSHQDAGEGRIRNTAVPVKVARVEQRDMAVIERTIGTVVANSVVSVTARVQGQLIAAHFKEGQMVKKGDLLFEIDPAPYQAALDSAQGVLLGAKSTAERSASLLQQNAIAPQANDNAQASYQQAKANVESARLNLDFTRIRSPIDGKTGPILLQPGNLVSVNGTNAPLVTIAQVQPIKVSFALPQVDLPRIQERARGKGLVARINLHDVGGGDDLSAPVDFISNSVNATSGTIELRATFPNANLALVPGQLVDVTVQLSDIPGALVVPREAINNGPDGQYVYVLTPDRTAEMRPVKMVYDDGTNAAVQGQLAEGDQVITDGQLRIVPGGRVTISRAQDTSQAGANAGRRGGRGGRGGRGRRGGDAAEGSPAPG